MLQKQICLNLNHYLTDEKKELSNVVLHANTVNLHENFVIWFE